MDGASLRRRFTLGLGSAPWLLVAVSLLAPVKAGAQTAIYYSVGTSFPADLKSASNVTISGGGVATFTAPQPDRVGVGDEVTYNGATKAYISGRTSSTVYSLITATGGTPGPIGPVVVNSITRAFGSLTTAEANSTNAAHLNTTNLTAPSRQLHWAMYNDNDSPMNDGGVLIDGYTTAANNYIRVFTPVAPSQVGSRQRHIGRAATGFRLRPVAAPGASYSVIRIADNHVRIEGIEIDGSGVTGTSFTYGIRADATLAATADIRIDKLLIHDFATAGTEVDVAGIFLQHDGTTRISNSIIYRIRNSSSEPSSGTPQSDTWGIGLESGSTGTVYVHSNTIYDIKHVVATANPVSVSGVNRDGGTLTVRNTAALDVADNGGPRPCFFGTIAAASNNVSSDATAPGAGSQFNKTSYATYFVNITVGSQDLHLRDDSIVLWGGNGADLDADPNLPIVDDVDGQARHFSQPDIGADEFRAFSCCDLTTTLGATLTVETSLAKMVWNPAAGNGGGGLREFYGLAEPNSGTSRVGDDARYNLFSTQINDGSWLFETGPAGAAGTIELLEATPTRVKARQRYNYSGNIHLERDWSVYAFPRFGIRESITLDAPQSIRGVNGITPRAPAVCPGTPFYCNGQSNSTDQVWVVADDSATYSDMLAMPYTTGPFFGRAGASPGWNTFQEAGTPRSVVARVDEGAALATPAGTETRAYEFYPLLPGLTSGGTEWQPYKNDYHNAATLTINGGKGSAWQDASENTGAGDWFNEAERAYLVNFNPTPGPTQGLDFDISGSVPSPRFKPFFKIRQWHSMGKPAVTLEGVPLELNQDFSADVKPISRATFCSNALCSATVTQLAQGGLVGHVDEYLNDGSGAKNFQFTFTAPTTEYLYLGSDAKFRGLNVVLATLGAGTAALQWQYWDGAWQNLAVTDETLNLKRAGTIYWGSDPAGWTPTSVAGSPSLYYVRAFLASGSYTTFPREHTIRTDILLFQYCGNITTAGATFAFTPPGTTQVTLLSFEATGADAAVELSWKTGSELANLGFHLYRGPSADGPWTRLTSSLVPGLGSSALGRSYSWRDSGLVNGQRYFYRLDDVDASSKTTSHGPVSAVPLAVAAGDGNGARQDDGRDRKKSSAAASCPDWVLAAYASAAGSDTATPSLRCTRHGDPEANSLGVVSRDSRQATLELRTGGFYALHEPAGTVRVFIPGFDFPQDERAAALPIRRALADAVVGRRVELGGVRALELASFRGLSPSALGKAEMQVGRDGTVRAARRGARGLGRAFPKRELVTLLPSLFQGEQKSAVVEIAPLRFDAQRQQLVLAKRVRFRLLFTGREAGESGRGSQGRAPAAKTPAVSGDVLGRFYTTSRGLHAVPFEQLFPGQKRGLAASELRLERQGEAVGFHLEPTATSFGPGGRLFFFADRTAASTDFTSEVAYELLHSRDGVQMPLQSAAPGSNGVVTASLVSRVFETNRFYQPGLLDAPDPWLWEALASGATRVKSFSLAGVLGSGSAALDVDLQGASESGAAIDHHVSVSLNGALVGEARFAGKQPYRLSLSLPASLLREGQNELSLTNVPDTGVSSLVFLDRFTLAHPQTSSLAGGLFEGTWNEAGTVSVSGVTGAPALVDVTGPARWLTGYEAAGGSVRLHVAAAHDYLVVSQPLSPRVAAPEPSTLRAGTNQADYLLIAPQAFLAAAAPLVERRQDQGLGTRAVAFEEITSEFGHGRSSAEAIKAFLSYTFHSWARPSPRYILLLGDSNYDPRNFAGNSQPSPLPALWTKTSFLWTASDPQLAAVNGEDSLPDLAIGRLPATSAEQAEALVQKLLAWEDSGQGLSGRAAFVADDPDVAGDFETNVEDVRSSFLASRETRVLKLSELGAGTRPAILDALNSGLSLLSYVGHGGAAVWASENVWNSWDASSLQAQSQQPLLVTMNCLNGYFVAPTFDSLSESLLKAEGRGAIASFSPSGLSLDGPAHQYHRALMGELTSARHERLGDAILAAQKAYAASGLMPELLGVYHLLGDPATKIR